jgi:hypothetical protein
VTDTLQGCDVLNRSRSHGLAPARFLVWQKSERLPMTKGAHDEPDSMPACPHDVCPADQR